MAERKLQSGDLDRFVTIYQKDELQDSFGTTGFVSTPFLKDLPARRRVKPGTEAQQTAEASRVTAKQKEVFDIRYRPEIKEEMLLEYQGKMYNITASYEGEGRKQWWVVECEKTD